MGCPFFTFLGFAVKIAFVLGFVGLVFGLTGVIGALILFGVMLWHDSVKRKAGHTDTPRV